MAVIHHLLDYYNAVIDEVPGATLDPAVVSQLPLTIPTRTIDRMVFYLNQEYGITHPGRTLSIDEIMDLSMADEIRWLILHGVPSRSIAFVIREFFAVLLPDQKQYAEQTAQIIEHFLFYSIGKETAFWQINQDTIDMCMNLTNLAATQGQNWQQRLSLRYALAHDMILRLRTSMEHAVGDTGGYIIIDLPDRQPPLHKITGSEFEEVLFRRMIKGSNPRVSYNITKKTRGLLHGHFSTDKLGPEIEAAFGYMEGDGELELALMTEKKKEICRTNTIDKRLTGPRAVPRDLLVKRKAK
ncbi:hypothetical protein LTR84_009550 [Exophiala bonariae]|uniref:Uncharacterized protein n=1 Tax=Exophiala bonariae TaxID=1690606 RepID=A0AAV9MUL8_9EURO|nr:hypothetical protein LTR84_009550 [Exophiala bonariae]